MMTEKLRAAAKAALSAMDYMLRNGEWYCAEGRANALRAALAEPDEQKPVAHPFEDASVISALYWASILIKQKYPVGHNGADSWLMNYSDKHGENVRRHDHREWGKVHGRWKPKAALAEPAIKDSLTVQRPWAGLTDREFQPMIKKAMGYYGYDKLEPSHLTAGAGFRVFANAIEAKLREKNT
jgi:hypothetical protein